MRPGTRPRQPEQPHLLHHLLRPCRHHDPAPCSAFLGVHRVTNTYSTQTCSATLCYTLLWNEMPVLAANNSAALSQDTMELQAVSYALPSPQHYTQKPHSYHLAPADAHGRNGQPGDVSLLDGSSCCT